MKPLSWLWYEYKQTARGVEKRDAKWFIYFFPNRNVLSRNGISYFPSVMLLSIAGIRIKTQPIFFAVGSTTSGRFDHTESTEINIGFNA